MIRTVLLWIAGLFILALIFYWVWSGGYGRAMNTYKTMGNPFKGPDASNNSVFRLPWQPDMPALPTATGSSDTDSTKLDGQYATLENQYEQLNEQANEAKVFGDPSPERGRVHITETYAATETDPAREYIVITASTGNTAPIALKNWSLQSAYTGVRLYIPFASSLFLMGIINDQEDVSLNPGGSASLNSGPSPVGTSFRENMCSGYLGQLRSFYPPLANSCPPASASLPFTPENLKVYGEECFNFLQNIPACTAPLDAIPNNANPNCRAFAANVLSYNGCVAANKHRTGFYSDTWRVYLGSSGELWRNSHDIIRLLDSDGRTVDVATY